MFLFGTKILGQEFQNLEVTMVIITVTSVVVLGGLFLKKDINPEKYKEMEERLGQDLDTELYELSVKASKLMQGEFEDDLPRMPSGNDRGVSHQGSSASVSGDVNPNQPREVL